MEEKSDNIQNYLYRPEEKRSRAKDVRFPTVHGSSIEKDPDNIHNYLYRPKRKRRRWKPKHRVIRSWYMKWRQEWRDYYDARVRFWLDFGLKRKMAEKEAMGDMDRRYGKACHMH